MRICSLLVCLLVAAPALAQDDAPPNPLGKKKPDNPLGKKPENPLAKKAPSPWVGEFASADGSVLLSLREKGALSGELTVGEQDYPLTINKSTETSLAGSFTAGGQAFEFSAELKGNDVKLLSGGATHDLERKGPPPNPLAGGGGGGAAKGPPSFSGEAAASTTIPGTYSGPANAQQGPQGLFSYDLPQGWTVVQGQPGVLGINVPPGAGGIKEAIVLLFYPELAPHETGKSAKKLMTSTGLDEVHQLLANSELRIQRTTQPAVTATRINGDDSAYAQWKGTQQTPQGAQGVSIWTSTVIRRHFAVSLVAVMVEGKHAPHEAKVKRIYSSTKILKVPPKGALGGGGGDQPR